MVSSTARVWPLDESSLFQAVLCLFVVQYCFGLGTFVFHMLLSPQGHQIGEWFDGTFLGLNAAVLLVFVVVLRLQIRHYEIDDAEEVLVVVNWLPFRYLSVSAVHSLADLADVCQIIHKDEVVVRVVFQGGKTLMLTPQDQEGIARALSAYLPHDHPNRAVNGVGCVYREEDPENTCCAFFSCKPPAILASRATEATWAQIRTFTKALVSWMALLAVVTAVHGNYYRVYYVSHWVWIVLFSLDTMVCLIAVGLWNMGNVAEYRVHADKLEVASAQPFICTESHHFNYFSSVHLIPGTETLRLSTAAEQRTFILGDIPCKDACAQEDHILIKRKTGLLDLVVMPENAHRFADVLAAQLRAVQHTAV